MSKEMVTLIKTLSDRPISFHRAYVKLTGSVNAALMLSQAMYWSSKTTDPDGWFYKTSIAWEDETGLVRREQDTARKQLKRTGFWVEKLRGVPATLHFRIDLEKMVSSLAESAKLDLHNVPNKNGGNCQTIPYSTETTTETTTISDSEESGELFPKGKQLKAKKKKDSDYPEYSRFIETWTKTYPNIGIKMPRDGAKVKALIEETRRQVQLDPYRAEPTVDVVCGFWDIFVANLHRTWGHGKNLAVIEAHYPSLIFAMEHGKQQKSSTSKTDQARDYVADLIRKGGG